MYWCTYPNIRFYSKSICHFNIGVRGIWQALYSFILFMRPIHLNFNRCIWGRYWMFFSSIYCYFVLAFVCVGDDQQNIGNWVISFFLLYRARGIYLHWIYKCDYGKYWCEYIVYSLFKYSFGKKRIKISYLKFRQRPVLNIIDPWFCIMHWWRAI